MKVMDRIEAEIRSVRGFILTRRQADGQGRLEMLFTREGLSFDVGQWHSVLIPYPTLIMLFLLLALVVVAVGGLIHWLTSSRKART